MFGILCPGKVGAQGCKKSEREKEGTLPLPSLAVPGFHLALLLDFLQSLIWLVNRGFWRSPLHPLALGSSHMTEQACYCSQNPSVQRAARAFPARGEGTGVSQDGEKQVGIQTPLKELFPLPGLLQN